MKIKVSDTTNIQLDWLVAKCLQVKVNIQHGVCYYWVTSCQEDVFKPSTDWSQGGPIIEQERITIAFDGDGINCDLTTDSGGFFVGHDESSPLIATMRCFVASKLGDEVEVPDELGEQS